MIEEIREGRYMSIDIKTTGLEIANDRITEICIVIRRKQKYEIEDEHKSWHIKSSISTKQCFLEFSNYIQGQMSGGIKLILFDAPLVLGFLNAELILYNLPCIQDGDVAVVDLRMLDAKLDKHRVALTVEELAQKHCVEYFDLGRFDTTSAVIILDIFDQIQQLF
ncbi:MAG: hypothetical protein LBI63_01525 [Candidatus Ancillula sp.]|jgi:DNA polymerase III epsilon subunit-like protein|nr:hypothetical protein [Candidatus Ancillula sp.]